MRLPRFTILQMLLAAALVGLVLGLATATWRTAKHAQISQLEFSPSGKYLAAKYSGGSIQVWDISGPRPRLTAGFPARGFMNCDFGPIRFADDLTLVDLQSHWSNTAYETVVRSMDLRTGRVTRGQAIPFAAYAPSFAATRKTLALPNWTIGAVELYDLPTGKLRTSIKLPGNPWFLALSDDERYLAASDQNSGLHIIEVATGKTLLTKAGATMLAALDIKGERLAAASWSTTGTTGAVELTELPGIAASRKLQTGMTYLVWLRLSSDGSRLAVGDYTAFEYYEVATGKLLTRVEFPGSGADADIGFFTSFSGALPGQNLALAPDGETLASFSGGQITLRDLPSGKSRLKITGGWRSLQILIFTCGFAGWAAAWGIVSRRERLRRGLSKPAVFSASLQPPPSRPANPPPRTSKQLLSAVGWIIVAVVMTIVLLSLESSWSISEAVGYGILTVISIVAAAIVLAIGYAWLMRVLKGPHYLSLVRLRQIALDQGRLHTTGQLTAAFFGPSNIEPQYASRAADVLRQAAELFGQPVALARPTLIACLDRQGDLDAYMRRHVPIAAVVPNVWTARLGLVCEETALRNISDPADAFGAALALLLTIHHKRGLLPGWVSTLCIHQMTKNERHAAGLRAACRRQRILAVRQPEWNPRQIFTRTANQRAALWLAADQPESQREVQAEIDFLATLGEMMLGPGSPAERREKVLHWIRNLRPKDDPLKSFTREVGLTLDELLAEWRDWRKTQTGLTYDLLPVEKAAAAGALHAPALWDRSQPAAERGRVTRQLGGSGYVALASLLLDELDDPRCDIRLDAIEAVENLSGEPLGDNPAAWNAWYEALAPEARDWPQVSYARAAADAPLVAVVLDDAARASAPPTSAATPAPAIPRDSRPMLDRPPLELKLCWGMMFLGGCAALTIPISVMFLWGPLFFPTIYFAIVVGVLAVAKGAARETLGLKNIAKMQAASLISCDPINMLLGSLEFGLLNRPHVLDYLIRANGGRL